MNEKVKYQEYQIKGCDDADEDDNFFGGVCSFKTPPYISFFSTLRFNSPSRFIYHYCNVILLVRRESFPDEQVITGKLRLVFSEWQHNVITVSS